MKERGLAASVRPHKTHFAATGDLQTEIVENGPPARIGEGDAVQFYDKIVFIHSRTTTPMSATVMQSDQIRSTGVNEKSLRQ